MTLLYKGQIIDRLAFCDMWVKVARAGFATASLYGELSFFDDFLGSNNNSRMYITVKQIEGEIGL
jgi:hypothetical protein